MKINFLFFILTSCCFSQNKLEINQKSPSIKITNWIANVPNDKSLDDKFIILEFWATWCSPCLKAVPHLNELKNKFNNKDVCFVSITDEPPKKIKKVLDLVKFNSIVVSDTTKSTQLNFGNGKKIKELPLTVLIDKQKKVRWIGKPNDLNEEILTSFFNNDSIVDNKKSYNNKNLKIESNFKTFLQISSDSSVKYFFKISISDKNFKIDKSPKVNKNLFYLESINLEEILTNVLDYNKNTFFLENVPIYKYDLIYKNKSLDFTDKDQIEKTILNTLGINKIKTNRIIHSYKTNLDRDIIDVSYLKESSIAYIEDKILLFSYNLEMLCDFLNKNTTKHFHTEIKDSLKFNIIFDSKEENNIILSLQKQGIIVNEIEKKSDFYIFKIK